MSDQSFDDFLKRTLQQSSDYIEDDNFSARVMASLPAPHRLNPWLERLIVALPVTLIALLVASQLPWRDLVRPAYGWLLTFDSTSLMTLAVGATLCLCCGCYVNLH
jgi:hypothetical protein